MLILSVEMLGIAYFLLFGLGWRLVSGVWNRSVGRLAA
jgi:hypothetical protein